MQSGYFAYLAFAYAFSGLVLIGLGAWIWFDARSKRATLVALEEAGIRRRSIDPDETGESGR